MDQVSVSVTKRIPFFFTLNPGHFEYELGILTAFQFYQASLGYTAGHSASLRTLTQIQPKLPQEDCFSEKLIYTSSYSI